MSEQWAQDLIAEWLAKGEFNKGAILFRLDERIRDSLALSADEWFALHNNFKRMAGPDGRMTETGFIALLHEKGSLPHSAEAINAARIIHQSMVYLSALPFVGPHAAVMNEHKGFTFNELARALVWVLPGRSAYVIEEGNNSRQRTQADHRRLLFQSLASTQSYTPYNPARAARLAAQNAVEEEPSEFYSSNHDSDGDEIYHDLLEVLYSTQTPRDPSMSSVPLDEFRDVGKGLAAQYGLSQLNSVGIPTERLTVLVTALLGLYFKPTSQFDLQKFTSGAQAMCAALSGQDDTGIVTWAAFDRALPRVAKDLFDPVYHMLAAAFLDKSSLMDVAEKHDPPRQFGWILDVPGMSQMATWANEYFDFGLSYRLAVFPVGIAFDPEQVLSEFELTGSPTILIVSGRGPSGERCTFGVYSSWPKGDRDEVKGDKEPDEINMCAIFQLRPVHDVFRRVIRETPAWGIVDNALVFGVKGEGVSLSLDAPSRVVEVRHAPLLEEHDWGSFRDTPWRGFWGLEFQASDIEVWVPVCKD